MKHNLERDRIKKNKVPGLNKSDIYEELKENFGGKIPYEIEIALEKEINLQQKNILDSQPIKEYFQGKEWALPFLTL